MRLLVFFDLPTNTSKERKNYRLFKKFLIQEGYIMQQYSVYSKLLINDKEEKYQINKLKLNKPPAGVVQLLTITEKQFANMQFITGSNTNTDYLEDSSTLVTIC